MLAFLLIGGLHGKPYYLAPAFPLLFAAGGVQLARWLRPALERASIALLIVAEGALLAPLFLPILSPGGMIAWSKALGVQEPRLERHRYNALPQHIADQFGWQTLVAHVAQAWDRIPPARRANAAIFAQNYGEAGAVDWFGPAHGLPPALAGHNEYWRWSRARLANGPPIEAAVVIGDNEQTLRGPFRQRARTGIG